MLKRACAGIPPSGGATRTAEMKRGEGLVVLDERRRKLRRAGIPDVVDCRVRGAP